MAPPVLQSGIFVSKKPSMRQRIQRTSPEVPNVLITRIPAEPVNQNQKFVTCGKSNAKISLAGKIIFLDADSCKENIKRLRDSVSTPVSAKGEPSFEGPDSPPLKKCRLVIIPMRNGLSDAELTWHAKNLENLLRNGNPNCDKFVQNQNNIHTDSNGNALRVLIIRAKDKLAQALQKHVTHHNEPLVPAQLGPTEDNLQKYQQPTLCASDLKVAEVNEGTGGDKSAPTECCVSQSEDCVGAEPPDSVQLERQYPAAVSTQTRTSLGTTLNDSDKQWQESEKVNYERCSKTKNFDFRVIAENFNFDGFISSNNAGGRFSANEEALSHRVVPHFMLDGYNRKVPAKLEPTKNRDPENALRLSTPYNLSLPSPGDSAPVLCTQNLGVAEASEFTGDNKSAATDSCIQQNEVSAEAYPSVPDHSKRHYPAAASKCFKMVEKHTQCETTTNGPDKRPLKPEKVNKISPKTNNFDFRAIAENLDADGCIISSNAGIRCSTGEAQRECVVSQALLDCNECEVPLKLEPAKKCDPEGDESDALCPSTPDNLSLPTPEDSLLAVCTPNVGVAEANEVIRGDESAPTDYSAVGKCCQAVAEYTHAQSKAIPNVSHKEPCKLEKTDIKFSSVTKNLDQAAAKNMDVDEPIRSNDVTSRCSTSTNEEVQRKCVVPQVPINSGNDIPTVVLEFPAMSSLNPSEVASKRQKRRLKPKRKCSKRVRSEYLERSLGVTQYTSFTHWTGGKVTVFSGPEPVKEEETSPRPGKDVHKYDAIPAENQDSHGISADHGNGGGACFNPQEVGSGSVDGHKEGRVCADAADTGTVSANGLSASTRGTDGLSVSEYNNDGICTTVSEEANEAFPNDTMNAVEALLTLKNKLNEKIAKTDARLAEEFGENAEQVVEFCDSLELGVSLGNLPHVNPENMKHAPSDRMNAVEALLNLNNLNENINSSDVKCADDLGEKAEQIVEFSDSQELDGSFGTLNLDHENMKDVVMSFWSYLRSLVRPEGFLGHPQMKFKCFFCGKLFARYIDLEGHSVQTHFEAWENIRNSYLRILVPYLPGGFLEGYPQLQFKCIFCSRLFSCCSDLEEHLSERHCGDHPYECPFCSERFNNTSSYSSHLNGHIYRSDYPSYTCGACCACYSSQWQLDLHTQTHERNSSPVIVDL